LGESPLRYVNLPLIDLMANPPLTETRIVDRYRRLLEHGGKSIAKALEAVADPAWQPVVFHCTAGKDRTGILAAVLLTVLRVHPDDIVNDYSCHRHKRDWLMSFLARRGVQGPRLAAIHPDLFDCAPETMREFLSLVDTEYGGARKFMLASGSTPEVLEHLENTLLDRIDPRKENAGS
jgi:hypothetical protein